MSCTRNNFPSVSVTKFVKLILLSLVAKTATPVCPWWSLLRKMTNLELHLLMGVITFLSWLSKRQTTFLGWISFRMATTLPWGSPVSRSLLVISTATTSPLKALFTSARLLMRMSGLSGSQTLAMAVLPSLWLSICRAQASSSPKATLVCASSLSKCSSLME